MTPVEIAAALTEIYRTPTGTMSLRPLQGRVLFAVDEGGGVFSNASVGLGKSLMFALLMRVTGGRRPMVCTEASNVPQMRADFERYRLHWQMPSHYRLESYETISNRPELLDEYNPTFLGLDEAQKVKPFKESGRARKFDRWRRTHPTVPVAALSGSPGEHFKDYAHLMVWSVPALAGTLIPVSAEGRPEGPEFRELCKRLKEDAAFHESFWTRLRETPGIVISSETYTDKPLHIKHTILPTPPEMVPHWERLRTLGEAPDGWLLDKGPAEQWGLARCFANGMFYEHVPRPPVEYSDPRKWWIRQCNDLIEDEYAPGGPYDTPGQVARAVLAGKQPRGAYDGWMRVKDTYKPLTKTTWLSRTALEFAHRWGLERAPLAERTRGGSIVWVGPVGVGEELSRVTGWPYYGDGAKNARGQHVRLATAPVIICSEHSCATGKNLQRYSRNLIMSPPSNCLAAEQRIGRTHRSEQHADCVEVEMLYACLEDWYANQKAEAAASEAEDDLTAPRKLLLASHDRTSYPGDDAGFAWKRVSRVEVEIPD